MRKDYIWNPATCPCENGNYLGSIIDDSLITCYEIIDMTKSTSTKTVSTKSTSTNFSILLAFLLIVIALLIVVSIYLIKYWVKQKYLLPYHVTTRKLKFDDKIKIEDFDFHNFLVDKKSYENTLVYNISYKISIGAKPFCIRFHTADGFIKVYDGTRYLVLFGLKEYEAVYSKIRCLIS